MFGNPIRFLFRFIFSLSGIFFGPLGVVLGFALGWLLDFLIVSRFVVSHSEELSMIPSLFFFWGQWVKFYSLDFSISAGLVKKVIDERLELKDWDLTTAKRAFLKGFEKVVSKKELLETARKLYPGFPINTGIRKLILETCFELSNQKISDELTLISELFDFDVEFIFESTYSWKNESQLGHSSLNWAYEILGLDQKASNQEIKSAYRKKMQALHPDKSKNPGDTKEAFHKVREAYELLIGRTKNEI